MDITKIRLSRQECADTLNQWIGMNKSGEWFAFSSQPSIYEDYIRVGDEDKERARWISPIITINDPPEDWKESITVPSNAIVYKCWCGKPMRVVEDRIGFDHHYYYVCCTAHASPDVHGTGPKASGITSAWKWYERMLTDSKKEVG